MTEPPLRKRFHIHLSTAIVLMFVAGTLIALNCVPEQIIFIKGVFRGWPYAFVVRGQIADGYGIVGVSYTRLAFDLAVALAILITVWFLSEWLIRHRAAQKES